MNRPGILCFWRHSSVLKLTSGLALVALLAAAEATKAQIEEGAPKGLVFDPTPIAFVVGGHKLQIPRSYLADFVYGKPNQTSVGLIAYLPELSPISPENAQCFADRTACDKIIEIVISDSVLPSVSEQLKRMLQERGAKIRLGPYGLRRYSVKGLDAQQNTYGRALKNSQFYLVTCTKSPSPFDTCTYHQNADVGISLKYMFRRTQLSHWETIHRRATELLASFEKD